MMNRSASSESPSTTATRSGTRPPVTLIKARAGAAEWLRDDDLPIRRELDGQPGLAARKYAAVHAICRCKRWSAAPAFQLPSRVRRKRKDVTPLRKDLQDLEVAAVRVVRSAALARPLHSLPPG